MASPERGIVMSCHAAIALGAEQTRLRFQATQFNEIPREGIRTLAVQYQQSSADRPQQS